MTRRFTPKVVTGNALIDGDAIWLTADDRWTPHMSEAELVEDAGRAEQRLKLAQSQPDRVVGAYLAEARMGRDGPEPVHFREAFRTRGPSNYPHGKQASA